MFSFYITLSLQTTIQLPRIYEQMTLTKNAWRDRWRKWHEVRMGVVMLHLMFYDKYGEPGKN